MACKNVFLYKNGVHLGEKYDMENVSYYKYSTLIPGKQMSICNTLKVAKTCKDIQALLHFKRYCLQMYQIYSLKYLDRTFH